MVEIVVPLRGEERGRPLRVSFQPARLIRVVFQNEVHFAFGKLLPHARCDLGEHMRRALVLDRMDGIEAKPVAWNSSSQ